MYVCMSTFTYSEFISKNIKANITPTIKYIIENNLQAMIVFYQIFIKTILDATNNSLFSWIKNMVYSKLLYLWLHNISI